MKRSHLLAVLLALVLIAPSAAPAGYGGGKNAGKAGAGLEKLKSLVGVWDTKDSDGQAVAVEYEVVSKGSAVMETIRHGDMPDMITMYHIDGDRLMMTHYCALGNQPRMKASVPAGDVKELRFSFVDGTNMKRTDPHMHNMVMQFLSDTHVHSVWSYYEEGRLKYEVAFELARRP
jgi:hypothetical protein